jgi:hypothetical protein
MSNAWETTDEDVLNVLNSMGKKDSSAEDVLSNLDHYKIERAALKGNDLETQTEYAYEEIKRQLTEGDLS